VSPFQYLTIFDAAVNRITVADAVNAERAAEAVAVHGDLLFYPVFMTFLSNYKSNVYIRHVTITA
jgi:hypothetical protein